uniref:transmembrane protein 216-like isoform X1 n=2 Tax=Oncorhynchus TaxID=8016 RepID=UPI001EAF2B75|nr:transmembrane protein 216-like isoform X1 [Oncorhynchus gorbuscha]
MIKATRNHQKWVCPAYSYHRPLVISSASGLPFESLRYDLNDTSQLSSTPLQVLFYLNSWYFAAYFLAEGLMFVYKGLLLPYPPASLTLDAGLLLVFLGLESLRIFYGWKGNLTERSLAMSVSVLVLVPCTVLSVYYLMLQTFVLRLEFILNAVLLCFYSLEMLLGIMSISAFSRSKVY